MKTINKKGFTLIELLISITMLIILSSYAISYSNLVPKEELIEKYYDYVQERFYNIYSQIILGKSNQDAKYIKISCNTGEKEFFGYNCYENNSGNIECKQIFFTNSYVSSFDINNKKERLGGLSSCGYTNMIGVDVPVNNFYIYIKNTFPYNIYYKLSDDGLLEDYLPNNVDDSIDKLFIHIDTNGDTVNTVKKYLNIKK